LRQSNGDDAAERCFRGGAFNAPSVNARASESMYSAATNRSNALGLRPIRMVDR
jgi:hypothetical protein